MKDDKEVAFCWFYGAVANSWRKHRGACEFVRLLSSSGASFIQPTGRTLQKLVERLIQALGKEHRPPLEVTIKM